jgi:hypothetical protein
MPIQKRAKTVSEIIRMDVFEKNKYDLNRSFRMSKAWYEQQWMLLAKQGMTQQSVYKGNPTQLTMKLMPGKMYCFFYEPLTKNQMDYYDRFPLVLLYKRSNSGFNGINFHYLPYQYRVVLLYRLMQYKTNNKMDENTRIKYNWAAIKGVSKFYAAIPAFKQYNFSGMRSQFREIRAYDWCTALLLPVEKMVNYTEDHVWEKSRQIVNRLTSG